MSGSLADRSVYSYDSFNSNTNLSTVTGSTSTLVNGGAGDMNKMFDFSELEGKDVTTQVRLWFLAPDPDDALRGV